MLVSFPFAKSKTLSQILFISSGLPELALCTVLIAQGVICNVPSLPTHSSLFKIYSFVSSRLKECIWCAPVILCLISFNFGGVYYYFFFFFFFIIIFL